MTWKDITIKQFKGIQEIVKTSTDEIDMTVKLLAFLRGKTEDHYLDLPIEEFQKEARVLSFLNQESREMIKEKYTVKGQVFTLNVNVSKMPAGQYIDYMNILQSTPDNFSLLLATLLIPEGKSYNTGYDIGANAELFEESFPWADVHAIAFFFSRLLAEYTKHTLTYLRRKLKREKRKEKNPERVRQIEKVINHLKAAGSGIS